MKSQRKHGRPTPAAAAKQAPLPSAGGDVTFVRRLAVYNDLPAPERAGALKLLGLFPSDPEELGILTKSHFVIPGETRYECQRCGECCRYARRVAHLTYDPCPFLSTESTCTKHDQRYSVCKWFPFWVYHTRNGNLLTIKPYCGGYGRGPMVDYAATIDRLEGLARCKADEQDGAVVIHEVLLVPGRKDWCFPSKENVDELMARIRRDALGGLAAPATDHAGEVAFAHRMTSGLLGSVHSALLTVDKAGTITDANDAACRILQRGRQQVVGTALPSFFVNPERVNAAITACFSRGKETASPQRLQAFGGAASPVLLDSVAYRDRGDGLVHGALVCVHPVSAAVLAEVTQSKDYARGLLDAGLDALIVIDKDGAILDANEALSTMTGNLRAALLGKPFASLFSETVVAGQAVTRALDEGPVRNQVLHLCSEAQPPIPVSVNATVYRDAEGIVQGIFAAARDIRERLKMIQDLEQAKTYARGLIECSIDVMMAIGLDGVVTDANRAATTITGRGLEDIVGHPFPDLFVDAARAQEGVRLVIDLGEVRDYRLELLGLQGRATCVSFNATLFRDLAGKAQGIFGVARRCDDATPRGTNGKRHGD